MYSLVMLLPSQFWGGNFNTLWIMNSRCPSRDRSVVTTALLAYTSHYPSMLSTFLNSKNRVFQVNYDFPKGKRIRGMTRKRLTPKLTTDLTAPELLARHDISTPHGLSQIGRWLWSLWVDTTIHCKWMVMSLILIKLVASRYFFQLGYTFRVMMFKY